MIYKIIDKLLDISLGSIQALFFVIFAIVSAPLVIIGLPFYLIYLLLKGVTK